MAGELVGGHRLPQFSPAPCKMSNLNGLSYWLPSPLFVDVMLTALVLAAVYVVARRRPPGISAAAALAGGLLTSHHALVHSERFPPLMRYWSLVLSIPSAYLLLLAPASSPWAQLAISGFPLAVLAGLAFPAPLAAFPAFPKGA